MTISESLPKGFFVEQVSAHDLDTGANAEIMYKIQVIILVFYVFIK